MNVKGKGNDPEDRVQLFNFVVSAGDRREIIRWVIHDNIPSTEGVISLLSRGLSDSDWEVRMSSVIACARLSVSQLLPELQRVKVPEISRSGLNAEERSIMLSIKKAALFLLSGGIPKPCSERMPNTQEEWENYLISCVAGEKMKYFHDSFLLVVALTSPLYPASRPSLPDCVEDIDGYYFLKKSKIQLCWVPGITHWIGTSSIPYHPIQLAKVEKGFFISKDLVTNLRDVGESNNPIRCTFSEAERFCRELSEKEKGQISMPSSLIWEMGARGHNGRLYPWGLSYGEGMLTLASPWGMSRAAGFGGEWTKSTTKKNNIIIMGASQRMRCYELNFADPDDKFPFRILIKNAH